MSIAGAHKKRKVGSAQAPTTIAPGPIYKEPAELTDITLQYLTLEDMVGFMALSREQIEAAELHNDGGRSNFKKTLSAHLLSICHTLKESGVRLIEEDGDEPHSVIVRTIQEQTREGRCLLENPKVSSLHELTPETPSSVKELQKRDALLNKINTELAFSRIVKISDGMTMNQIFIRDIGLTRLTQETIQELQKKYQPVILNLGWNQLTSIKGIEALTSLEKLYLHCNQLSSLKGIRSLTNLTMLSVQKNRLSSLEEIEELPALTNLDIEDNPLDRLTRSSRELLEKTCNHQYIPRIEPITPPPVFLPLMDAQASSSSYSSSSSSPSSSDEPVEKTTSKRRRD